MLSFLMLSVNPISNRKRVERFVVCFISSFVTFIMWVCSRQIFKLRISLHKKLVDGKTNFFLFNSIVIMSNEMMKLQREKYISLLLLNEYFKVYKTLAYRYVLRAVGKKIWNKSVNYLYGRQRYTNQQVAKSSDLLLCKTNFHK